MCSSDLLAQALLEESGRARLLPSFLKVVAIATIADAVSLSGENRVFAKLGLEGLRSPVNVGLKALLQVAELTSSQRRLSGSDVAFRIAPRLNAAGRMDVARDVIELFTVSDATRARELAEKLDQLNSDRQREEQRIVEEIQKRLESDAAQLEPYCLVLDGEGWHRGVIGIVATRVVERLAPGAWDAVHGGYDNTAALQDPNRVVPLDAMRALEREGMIGKLLDGLFVTVGNGGNLNAMRRIGSEIAQILLKRGVGAVVLPAT